MRLALPQVAVRPAAADAELRLAGEVADEDVGDDAPSGGGRISDLGGDAAPKNPAG